MHRETAVAELAGSTLLGPHAAATAPVAAAAAALAPATAAAATAAVVAAVAAAPAVTCATAAAGPPYPSPQADADAQLCPAPSPTSPRVATTDEQRQRVAELRAQMDAPFTVDEVTQLVQRTPLRKSVVGPLAPWLLRAACPQLAPLATAELNAWRFVRCLPSSDSRSAIALVPKPGKPPTSPADLRGIAVGALLAKLYAAGLERRVTDHAEAAGVHADGQFGFRRQRTVLYCVTPVYIIHHDDRLWGGHTPRE